MSRSRQSLRSLEDRLVVRSLAVGLRDGSRLDEHSHPWAQLVYASEGVLTVETEAGSWVVPSRRAVWVPCDARHALVATGSVRLRTLYFRPDTDARLPSQCTVVGVSPLLRELIHHVVELGSLDDERPEQERLAKVLVDLLVGEKHVPLKLPMPSDPRARCLALRVRSDPAGREPLERLARGCGASPRTLERLFRAETGLSFGRWRQLARLLEALRSLARGEPVLQVALDAGYESPSAFIAIFKRTLGTTPGRYFRDS